MSNKFKEIPIDKDTKIVFRQETKVDKFDCLHEVWSWDSIIAESLIFDNEDVENLNDNELQMMITSPGIPYPGSSVLIKRSDSGYTFVNFNLRNDLK